MPGIHPDFIQEGPSATGVNAFDCDGLPDAFLRWRVPKETANAIRKDSHRFGARCGAEIHALGEQAESEPPRHVPFDPWGRRIDEIVVSNAWRALDRISAEEGLVAIAYERGSGEHSRVHQFIKLFLFHPVSAFYTCPLAMTDGAARVLELHGADELRARALRRLTSRDPNVFWTSGQWMTERTGGSDVSGTSTVARAATGEGTGRYLLSGDKWFTSATTSQMTMALAKVEGATDAREGLSLFFVELRDERGRLKNIRVNRLKDKLGTRALPTAELTLVEVPGTLVGGIGDGVKTVSSLLNITRLYNSVTALGTISRGLYLAKDYAKRRSAFGQFLSEQPLHLKALAEMQADYEAAFLLCFHLIHLLGKDETGSASAEEAAILRLLTPVIKLWSAKLAIAISSEVLESFGGAGYIEDTGIPKLLRDSQVFSIWEGTTNVLSLDVLRAIAKEKALVPLLADVERRLQNAPPELLQEAALVRQAAEELSSHSPSPAGARAFAMGLARVSGAAHLLEFAAWAKMNGRPSAIECAREFCSRPLVSLARLDDLTDRRLKGIVYGP